MYDDLYGAQDIRGSTSVDLSKGIVVCPFTLFIFFFLFFFLCGLNGSFYLTLICPLWVSLSSLRYFPHFRGNTLYITISIEDLSHFTKVLNIKKMKLS